MMEKGNFSRAEELFKKALSLNPGYPHTYFGLALLYRIAGHLEESLSDQLARECLEWFKFVNPEGLKRVGLKIGLKPKI